VPELERRENKNHTEGTEGENSSEEISQTETENQQGDISAGNLVLCF